MTNFLRFPRLAAVAATFVAGQWGVVNADGGLQTMPPASSGYSTPGGPGGVAPGMSDVQYYSPTVPNPITVRPKPGRIIPRRPPQLRPHTSASSYFRAGAYDAAKVLSTQPAGRWYDPSRTGYELPDNECYRYASPFGYTSRYYGGEPYYSQRPPYYISTFPGGFYLLGDPCEISRWQDPHGGARTPEVPAMSKLVIPRVVSADGPAPAVLPSTNAAVVPAPAPAAETPVTPSSPGTSP